MKATFNVPGGIKTLTQSPEISKYYNDNGTVYTDIDEVNYQLKEGIRYIGLTVNINNEEYWYKDGIDDSNLISKGGGSISPASLIIEKTKSEIDDLISDSSLVVGATYKISGVHKSLYVDSYTYEIDMLSNSFDGGSGYEDGGHGGHGDTAVPMSGGTGTGVKAHVEVSGGEVVAIYLEMPGSGYSIGDVLTVDNSYLGGIGSGFSYTIIAADMDAIPSEKGTTIYLQALTSNTLSKTGSGEFWNPRYDKNIDGFGIWSNRGTWTATQPSDVTTIGNTIGNPYNMCMDSNGNIYTANYNAHNVSKITPDGTTTILGTTGNYPGGIAIDSDNNIYTTNEGSNNVTKITPDGISTTFAVVGAGNRGIAIDSNDNVYVINAWDSNVSKITPDGTTTIFGTTSGYPKAIVIDSDDNIYTANEMTDNVTKITPNGISTTLGTTGSGPLRIAIDSNGNIYTTNISSDNVSKITPDGTSTILGTTGSGLNGIAIDSNNNVYVSNYNNNNVSKITPDGTSSIIGNTNAYPSDMIISDGYLYVVNQSSNNITKMLITAQAVFLSNEEITSNNGATGELIGVLGNNTFLVIEGDWANSTSITGNYSGAFVNISNINIMSSNIGDKAIWGGYHWSNITGNIGYNYDDLQLSLDWVKILYSENDYNKSIDIIEYDYDNDWIARRYDPIGNIDVKMRYMQDSMSAIPYMMFGNVNDGIDGIGLSDIYVNNGVCYMINFTGMYASGISVTSNSSMAGNTFNYGIRIEDISLSSHSTLISNSFFDNISNVKLVVSEISNNQFNSSISNVNMNVSRFSLNSIDSEVSYLTMYDDSVIEDIKVNGRFSYITMNKASLFIGSVLSQMFGITFAPFSRIQSVNLASDMIITNIICEVYTRPDDVTKIRYWNNDDNLVVADITDTI